MFELLKPSTQIDRNRSEAIAPDALTMAEFWLLTSAFASLLLSLTVTALHL